MIDPMSEATLSKIRLIIHRFTPHSTPVYCALEESVAYARDVLGLGAPAID